MSLSRLLRESIVSSRVAIAIASLAQCGSLFICRSMRSLIAPLLYRTPHCTEDALHTCCTAAVGGIALAGPSNAPVPPASMSALPY